MEGLGLALSYDDVRLRTGHSKIAPADVDLTTKFSRNITLKCPLASAPMDTVTTHHMAIELAKLGGIGIIHRGFSPSQQAHEVARVKFYLNGLIEKPICVNENETMENIKRRQEEKGYSFHSFPVVNGNGILVGLLTNNDFEFCIDQSAFAKKVMSKELVIAKKGTTINEAFQIMQKSKKKVLPLVDSQKKLAGMYVFSDVKRIVSGGSSNYNLDKNGQLRVGAAVGVGSEALERIEMLTGRGVDVIVVDTAHGDSQPALEILKQAKKQFPALDIVVGNISEPESAKRLALAGADGIKVGQGPGSICTTRIVAGIGCPQLTAVYNCSKAVRGSGIPVCADGGIRYSGDISIAIGAGADSVMLGNLLAGTKEAPGEMVIIQGVPYKNYRGMGSLGAMQESKAARERYRQPDGAKNKLVPEGVEGAVPYKGEVAEIIYQLLGGLRSGMGYVGAANIKELQDKADFYRISGGGLDESHPHNITITKEPPNYR
ncbi:MAG: IMP dehydrogenase [Candidatus Portnoybacteria bacterium]|nr:IMP dehydrogenase [Candidatus Portnoybacteria bacterium]